MPKSVAPPARSARPQTRSARSDTTKTGTARTGNADRAGTRERILRATLELIATDGVGAVTNRRVAAAAGVSLGSLTYHFTSQTELLHESVLLYVEEETARREQIARELSERKPDLAQAAQEIERVVAGSVDIPQQIAELELHLQAARDPALREASQRCFAAHKQIATAALAYLGLPESEQAAATIVALMTGLAIRRLADGGHDAQGTSEALLTVIRGLSTEGIASAAKPAQTAG